MTMTFQFSLDKETEKQERITYQPLAEKAAQHTGGSQRLFTVECIMF